MLQHNQVPVFFTRERGTNSKLSSGICSLGPVVFTQERVGPPPEFVAFNFGERLAGFSNGYVGGNSSNLWTGYTQRLVNVREKVREKKGKKASWRIGAWFLLIFFHVLLPSFVFPYIRDLFPTPSWLSSTFWDGVQFMLFRCFRENKMGTTRSFKYTVRINGMEWVRIFFEREKEGLWKNCVKSSRAFL